MPQEEHFFDQFSRPTYEEWREAAEKTLKGVPFEKKLITRTYEEIDLQPMYWQHDAENIAHINSLPGFAPYLRGSNASGYNHQSWEICQELSYATPQSFNEALRMDMERGQTAVNMLLDTPTRAGIDASDATAGETGNHGVSISCLEDLAQALDGIDLAQTPIFIQAGAYGVPIAGMLTALVRRQGKPTTGLRGCIAVDPLGTLAREGTLHCSLDDAYEGMARLTQWARSNAPDMDTILVQSHPYHDGGGSATQELAFAMATGVEYLRALQSRGVSIDDAALSMQFAFSLGSNFFMEIAKLRAARLLWAKIVKAFGGSEAAQKMIIHARTSAWNKTTYDPYVNMLRTTTEAFAGVVGGSSSLHVSPFDEPIRPPDFFSRRIARNTQIILQQESHLDRVIDPAGGSWYVENLTDNLGKKAWGVFQEVEKLGGMEQALVANRPQSQVAETAQKRVKNMNLRRDVFVGINMYPNLQEKPVEVPAIDREAIHRERKAHIDQHKASVDQGACATALDALIKAKHAADGSVVDAAADAVACGSTIGILTKTLLTEGSTPPIIEPICIHRGTQHFEALRKNADDYAAKTGAPPKVFLANMGPIPQHKPRADFTTGFFQVGGFEVIGNNGFGTTDEAAQAALDSGAPIVVICSTDDTYPELVPPLTKAIKDARPETTVILAGYPQDQIDAHKQAGVDDFIHLRANCYEMLVNLQQKIGVTA